MAYFSQAQKAAIAPAVKAICKKYGVSASLAVRNNEVAVLNIGSGVIDFIGNANEIKKVNAVRRGEAFCEIKDSIQVNVYHVDKNFSGQAAEFLKEVYAAMNAENHDNSDAQRDYFDVGYYVDINVGRWGKPYELKAA